MTTVTLPRTAVSTIAYSVACEPRFGEVYSYTSFEITGDGAGRVTVETSALVMALHLSGLRLHRGMSVQDIAWACVAGVRAAGGPSMLVSKAETAHRLVLKHLARDTDVWADPVYRQLWPSQRRQMLCVALVHSRLLRNAPVGEVGTPIGTYSSAAAHEVA